MPDVAGQIDGLLKKRGSPMAGLGSVFVGAAKKYGVDPRLVVSISGIESGFGKHILGGYNAWGWGPGIPFGSWEEGISTVTRGIKDGYYARGLRTPDQIVTRYAPGSDGNDEGNWARTVSEFMQQIGGTAPVKTVKVGGSTGLSTTPSLGALAVPSSSGLESALISNLGSVAQHGGKADPFSMLSSLLGGASQDRENDALRRAAQTTAPKPVDTSGPHKPGKDFAGRMGVVSAVKQELGLPYSWGGGGPAGPSYGSGRGAQTKGFDCSSLLQYGWAKAGVAIPRVTYDQWKAGRPVNDPRPGDAVFFNMGPKGPEHVGIFIGGGKFIEAAHTGTNIRVSSLAGRSDYLGARTFA